MIYIQWKKFKMTDIDNYVPTKRSTFLYFAYGSNLWTNRLRLQNPTAERKTIAKLKVRVIVCVNE